MACMPVRILSIRTGATGVIYKAGDRVATLTTDENGKASVENLYLGEYFIKEITPPVGYLADEQEHDLVCSYEGDLTATVKRECVSLEQVKKQPFEIIKAANNGGETDADLLSGAGFTAYLLSELTVKEDGSYDFDSAEPVVIGENGATEMFTTRKDMPAALPFLMVHTLSVRQPRPTITSRWTTLSCGSQSITRIRPMYGGCFWMKNLKRS